MAHLPAAEAWATSHSGKNSSPKTSNFRAPATLSGAVGDREDWPQSWSSESKRHLGPCSYGLASVPTEENRRATSPSTRSGDPVEKQMSDKSPGMESAARCPCGPPHARREAARQKSPRCLARSSVWTYFEAVRATSERGRASGVEAGSLRLPNVVESHPGGTPPQTLHRSLGGVPSARAARSALGGIQRHLRDLVGVGRREEIGRGRRAPL
mmetsp:Transcript_88283/g.184486  ORF Transcript_88283/g.184486 Transcript_88283/m.184486 type:complete len:212 (+) Transcript_88283:152-787(+)